MPVVKPLVALIACATMTGMLASCAGPTRDDIPGNVPFGSTERVASAAEGFGSGDAFDSFGMTRLAQVWEPEELTALKKPAEAIWYHYPQKSRDKLSGRGGFTMVVIYDLVVWADEDSQANNLVPLGTVTDLRNTDQGLSFATTVVPEQFKSGMRTIGERYRLPYAQGGVFISPPAGAPRIAPAAPSAAGK